MNWDAVGAVGEIIGAVAVLITLIYLSIQVRQHGRQLESANEQAAFSQLTAWIHRMSTDSSAKALFEKIAKDQPLSEQDEADWAWILAELTNVGEAHFVQYKKAALSHEVWLKYERALTAYLVTPVGKRWWFNRMAPFSDEFTEHFDRLLKQPDQDLNFVSSIHQNKDI